MPTFRAISRIVNLASPSMISFILETISLRDADFGLPDFGVFLMDSTPDSNFFFQHSFVEIDHEMFSTVILSLPLIQEGQLSVSGERMCTILVNRLED